MAFDNTFAGNCANPSVIPVGSPGSRYRIMSFFRIPDTVISVANSEGGGFGYYGDVIHRIGPCSDIRILGFHTGATTFNPITPAHTGATYTFRGNCFSFRVVSGGTSYQCELNPIGSDFVDGATGAIDGYKRKFFAGGVYPSLKNLSTPSTALNNSALGNLTIRSLVHNFAGGANQQFYGWAAAANINSGNIYFSQDPGVNFTTTLGILGGAQPTVGSIVVAKPAGRHRAIALLGTSITRAGADTTSLPANYGHLARGFARAIAEAQEDGDSGTWSCFNIGTDGLAASHLVALDANSNNPDYRPDIWKLIDETIPVTDAMVVEFGVNDYSATDAVVKARIQALFRMLRLRATELGYPNYKLIYKTPTPYCDVDVARAGGVGITITGGTVAARYAELNAAAPSATNYRNVQKPNGASGTSLAALSAWAVADATLASYGVAVFNTLTGGGYAVNASSENVFANVNDTTDGVHPVSAPYIAEVTLWKAFLKANV